MYVKHSNSLPYREYLNILTSSSTCACTHLICPCFVCFLQFLAKNILFSMMFISLTCFVSYMEDVYKWMEWKEEGTKVRPFKSRSERKRSLGGSYCMNQLTK